MKGKIEKLLQNENLTAGKLAELLDVHPSAISQIRSGARDNLSYTQVQKILRRFPHINPDWLLLNAENMYRDGYEQPAPAETPSLPDLFTSAASEVKTENTSASEQNKAAESEKILTSRESHILESTAGSSEILNSRATATIERIIVLYSDGTFRDFDKR